MRFTTLILGFLIVTHAVAEDEIITSTRTILTNRCLTCHQPGGVGEAFVQNTLDREELVTAGLVVPGAPEKSSFYEVIDNDKMPLGRNKLNAAEKKTIYNWIKAGAPPLETEKPSDSSVTYSAEELVTLINEDLNRQKFSDWPFLRYVSFAHLSRDKGIFEKALSKLLNSLSWKTELKKPQAINDERTVFRVDLRAYDIKINTWDKLAHQDPWRTILSGTSDYPSIQALTRSGSAIVRGDWWIGSVSLPATYHEFLQLPATVQELESLLKVDTKKNFASNEVARSGFAVSGISLHNRLIERHPTPYGSYWKSYDFFDSKDEHDIFRFPFTPDDGSKKSFTPAGGEIIFSLPNGLQGYLLATGDGKRIDEAPIQIVSDRLRPERGTVVNGIACMSCHQSGIFPKKDETRPHVLNSRLFSVEEKEKINVIHDETQFQALVLKDVDRFQKALNELSINKDEEEPILSIERDFASDLNLNDVLSTIGLQESDLDRPEIKERIRQSADVEDLILKLRAKGTSIRREVFESFLGQLIQFITLGSNNLKPEGFFEGPLPGMTFVALPGGTFTMGDRKAVSGANNPAHDVTLSPFEIMTTEVTHEMWKRFFDTNCSKNCGVLPVTSISWNSAQKFIDALNRLMSGLRPRHDYVYRLPTEAEWEYAARAGTTTEYFTGDGEAALKQAGWYYGNANTYIQFIAQKLPNTFGIYDMHGNASEWVQDLYSSSFYENSPKKDPTGPSKGDYRVIRGGASSYEAKFARSDFRHLGEPDENSGNRLLGFRIVRQKIFSKKK